MVAGSERLGPLSDYNANYRPDLSSEMAPRSLVFLASDERRKVEVREILTALYCTFSPGRNDYQNTKLN
jgi:hypothetical protein